MKLLKAGVRKHGKKKYKWALILADEANLYLRERGRTNVNLKDKWRTLTLEN